MTALWGCLVIQKMLLSKTLKVISHMVQTKLILIALDIKTSVAFPVIQSPREHSRIFSKVFLKLLFMNLQLDSLPWSVKESELLDF